jgi:hypothetical protein
MLLGKNSVFYHVSLTCKLFSAAELPPVTPCKEEKKFESSASELPSVTPCKEEKKSESSLRRALSPISSNVKQQSSDTGNCTILLEAKTPVQTCKIVEKIPATTPLDKFNALGSTLKVCMTPLLIS